jgi:hypothetical protein
MAMEGGCRYCDAISCSEFPFSHSEIPFSQDDRYCDSKKDDMEEEILFLRKWSFVPGELTSPPSATGDYVTLFCNSDGSEFFAHSLILVSCLCCLGL